MLMLFGCLFARRRPRRTRSRVSALNADWGLQKERERRMLKIGPLAEPQLIMGNCLSELLEEENDDYLVIYCRLSK